MNAERRKEEAGEPSSESLPPHREFKEGFEPGSASGREPQNPKWSPYVCRGARISEP
jgi:hypothetical protein